MQCNCSHAEPNGPGAHHRRVLHEMDHLILLQQRVYLGPEIMEEVRREQEKHEQQRCADPGLEPDRDRETADEQKDDRPPSMTFGMGTPSRPM